MISWSLLLLIEEKISDVVKNQVIKKTVYDELVKKVNAINTTALVKRTVYDKKINEIEREVTSITELATTAALNAVGNKIPSVSDPFKKQNMMQKYQVLRVNISPHLVVINLWVLNLMQR